MYAIKGAKVKFTAGQAAEAAGVAYHHVNHWCKIGLIVPSVSKATGSDSLRVYSFADIVAMRAVGQLRSAGFTCDAIKNVAAHLQAKRYSSLAEVYLIGDESGDVREVQACKLLAGIEGAFAWFLNLSRIVKDVDETAAKRVRAKRGRASMVC